MYKFDNSPIKEGEREPFINLIFILLLVFGGMLVGGILVASILSLSGNSISSLSLSNPPFINLLNIVSHIFMFIVPVVVILKINKKKWGDFNSHQPHLVCLLVAIIALFVSTPFISWIHDLNQGIPLPEWMQTQSDEANKITKAIAQPKNIIETLIAILAVAIVPAIGEELIFRGFFQSTISKIAKNHHIGILLASLIFSAIHFQWDGFFTRWIMGALLGYTYFLSGNILTSMVFHFINNLITLFLLIEFNRGTKELNPEEVGNYGMTWGILSLVLTIGLLYFLFWFVRKHKGVNLTSNKL